MQVVMLFLFGSNCMFSIKRKGIFENRIFIVQEWNCTVRIVRNWGGGVVSR
jgi:hypothetical protein